MDKLDMMSKDNVQANIEKIKELFPNAVTEVVKDGKVTLAVDFDVLKQEMSDIVIDDKQERYQFTWPDKKKAILLANSPISATLRPSREESVDFDNTENLYIEGDNLDVLKLLQETYLGKIKMIYIDPPYNTGNDFVYNDDFAESSEEYLANSGQYDEQGNRLVVNSESNGRFHTDWLNMIYPRLKIAKDLLTDNGAIFISIDENEIGNLRKVCDEIFGSRNFVTEFIWRKSKGSGNDSKYIMVEHEYILMYSKNIDNLLFNNEKVVITDDVYGLEDEFVSERGKYNLGKLDRGSKGYVKSLDYGIEAPDGSLVFPNGRDCQFDDGWRWMWSKQKVEWGIKNGFIVVKKGANDKWNVYAKSYAYVDNENKPIVRTKLHKSHLGFDETILNITANAEIKNLFEKAYFSYPKPIALLKKLVSMLELDNEYVLDFFSGSATTAHAIMQLNADDGKRRKMILVQLPEICDEKSEAYKAGYKNICEIGKERIRRAGKKIKEENGLTATNLDIGFRVLKLDSSNMKEVYYKPEEYSQNFLAQFEDNIKEDRTALDLLFQVMLDLGKPLSAKIEEKVISGKHVFVVDDNDLIACFDKEIT
ncbi:MAG: site-specific DNA-methyltransferase, partial [Clostridia bacterium]|nr:site-specific DNA-methyltransferase [Clostridia bacterium]